jgi:hypothetical protein
LVKRIEVYYRDKLDVVKTDFCVEAYSDCLLAGDPERGVEVLQNIMQQTPVRTLR